MTEGTTSHQSGQTWEAPGMYRLYEMPVSRKLYHGAQSDLLRVSPTHSHIHQHHHHSSHGTRRISVRKAQQRVPRRLTISSGRVAVESWQRIRCILVVLLKMDRVSDLSKNVWYVIFSFLPMPDLLRVCLVSRTLGRLVLEYDGK